jgi:hypothetical protein
MKEAFEIIFDFSLAPSNFVVTLRAKVELHRSGQHYLVSDFHPVHTKPGNNHPSSLPPQEVKRIKTKRGHSWVHRDSDKETLLSIAIGKAIDDEKGLNPVDPG